MKSLRFGRRGVIASLLALAATFSLLAPTNVTAQSDPLPSWNEGKETRGTRGPSCGRLGSSLRVKQVPIGAAKSGFNRWAPVVSTERYPIKWYCCH